MGRCRFVGGASVVRRGGGCLGFSRDVGARVRGIRPRLVRFADISLGLIRRVSLDRPRRVGPRVEPGRPRASCLQANMADPRHLVEIMVTAFR